jgi:hypothetical protein
MGFENFVASIALANSSLAGSIIVKAPPTGKIKARFAPASSFFRRLIQQHSPEITNCPGRVIICRNTIPSIDAQISSTILSSKFKTAAMVEEYALFCIAKARLKPI